jgi:pyrroloquinoline quinone (PQQ) biosynthesis protein C
MATARALVSEPSTESSSLEALPWLQKLRIEVERHPAVNHTLLARLATGPYTKRDYLSFGLQHFALVGFFTSYLERLLLRAPSSTEKLWLAKVLIDEYGEGSRGEDHATLYRSFLRHAGASEAEISLTALCSSVAEFVWEHLRICRQEPFLAGLGALGPGHEWSIPKMFGHIIPGLQRAGFSDQEIEYFHLHVEQDQDHGAWMSEVLTEMARSSQEQEEVRRGALHSLQARARLWTDIERSIVGWRNPQGLPCSSRKPAPTLRDLQQRTRGLHSDHDRSGP